MIQNWAPEWLSWITTLMVPVFFPDSECPNQCLAQGSPGLVMEALWRVNTQKCTSFPTYSLASRAASVRAGHASPTQSRLGFVIALWTGKRCSKYKTYHKQHKSFLFKRGFHVWCSMFHRYNFTVLQVENKQTSLVTGRSWPRELHPHFSLYTGGWGSHHTKPHRVFKSCLELNKSLMTGCWVKETSC